MNEQKQVRTRIAPSPTGAPHIGTAYIALFNYAFAKKMGGHFILRIEDTDQSRCTPESERAILDALRWIGIPWDEGPDVGGPFGPYRQSERAGIYREHCKWLVEKGHAYPCFCTAERLARLRQDQTAARQDPGYDGFCASIPEDQAQARIQAGETHVIRMRVPSEGDCVFQDRIRGEIRIAWNKVDKQILLKSDGFPTYHLANVIDDHLMGITHVMRGEEWISSAPKHILLYNYFGWDVPEFIHLPLLRNPDKSKLSKRKNPTSILYYRDAGYLPEAMLNYLGLMAYSMPDGREIFTLRDMVESFNINRISLGGPVFDLTKLTSFNGQYIRALEPADVAKRAAAWKINDDMWRKITPLARQRLSTLSDLVPMTAFIFADRLDYPAESLITGDFDGLRTACLLKTAQWEIEKTAEWNPDVIRNLFSTMAASENVKIKQLMIPFYVAIAGTTVSLPLFDSMEILGKDMVLRRLAYALEALAGKGFTLTGKTLRELEKKYDSTYRKSIQAQTI